MGVMPTVKLRERQVQNIVMDDAKLLKNAGRVASCFELCICYLATGTIVTFFKSELDAGGHILKFIKDDRKVSECFVFHSVGV